MMPVRSRRLKQGLFLGRAAEGVGTVPLREIAGNEGGRLPERRRYAMTGVAKGRATAIRVLPANAVSRRPHIGRTATATVAAADRLSSG